MNVGKAIYYLLANAESVTNIAGTRIYPELAEQEAAAPYAVYQIVSVNPDDTNDGPAVIDEVVVDVLCVAESYNEAADLASVVRSALDRVRGTYNGVNVESIQYDSTDSDVQDSPRRYEQTVTLTVRVFRDAAQIATGQDIDQLTLGRLADVTITDPLEHDALIYDPDTETWVNGIPTDIPVINTTGNTLYAGSPLRATGVQGDKVEAALWSPNQDPKLFMGLAADDIAASETGHCRQIGLVHHLDTSDFEIGDILYPLAATLQFGIKRLGTTPPDHPLARVACAIVLRKHENTGRVFVRTWQPTYDFNDISEVNIATTPDDGQALTYDSATGTWVPGNATPRLLGDISDVQTYDPALLQDRTILRWGATSQTWELVPQTSGLPSAYYLGAYDSEAGTGRTAASTASITVERYLTIQGDGEGESISAQSDTPSAGNVIRRKIWYKANSFEDSDVDTWTLVHTFADDTAFADTEATFEALLNEQTYGTPPFTLAQSWEDIPAFTGLLDTYSGAAAAYSLRLLDSTYTGDAINVRRASDNAVQDIGFDANGDLDTSALATFCAGTDGYVVRWYDQSGNSNDVVQATTSAQPQIVSSGAVITDPDTGLPAAYSAGTQWMYNDSFTPTLSGFVMFMVHHQLVYDGTDTTVGYWGVDNGSQLTIANNYSLLPTTYDRTYFFGTSLDFTPITAQTVIRSTTYNNSSAEVFINNTSKATGTPGALGTTAQRLSIFEGLYTTSGGVRCIQGYVSSFIFYPSSSVIADRADIESNLATYYGITL